MFPICFFSSSFFCFCSNFVGGLIWEQLTYVGGSAFESSGISGDIYLPNCISTTPWSAFSSTDITSFVAPQITQLANNAFYNCNFLSYIDLTNVDYIGSMAFLNCESLETVTLCKSNIVLYQDFIDSRYSISVILDFDELLVQDINNLANAGAIYVHDDLVQSYLDKYSTRTWLVDKLYAISSLSADL